MTAKFKLISQATGLTDRLIVEGTTSFVAPSEGFKYWTVWAKKDEQVLIHFVPEHLVQHFNVEGTEDDLLPEPKEAMNEPLWSRTLPNLRS